MQSTHINAELATAQDRKEKEYRLAITHLKACLAECLEYIQDIEFDRPSRKTANMLERGEDAIWDAERIMK